MAEPTRGRSALAAVRLNQEIGKGCAICFLLEVHIVHGRCISHLNFSTVPFQPVERPAGYHLIRENERLVST